MNQLLPILERLAPVLSMFALAMAIEFVIPLRAQKRNHLGRIPTNVVLMVVTLLLGMILNISLAAFMVSLSDRNIGLFGLLGIEGVLAFLLALIVLDVAIYFTHVALHSIPLFWRAHLVHHMDAAVDVTTAYRQHPLEGILRFIATAFTAISFGMPAEAVAFYRLAGAVNSSFEHANLKLPAMLERILIVFWVTPDMHKMHHSRRRLETDSNYANLFSFVDRFFGTFTSTKRLGEIQYGIQGYDTRAQHAVGFVLALPFRRELQAPDDAVSAGEHAV